MLYEVLVQRKSANKFYSNAENILAKDVLLKVQQYQDLLTGQEQYLIYIHLQE